MRKEQKKQAEEFLAVLTEAHVEIKKQWQKHAFTKVQELLQQCQQGAIQLGNLIENMEGEDFVTIRYLEDYCETVYQIYEEAGQPQPPNADHIYKILRRQQIRIENSVKNDIQLRKEVVFLPYKASMWDSLESVWKAACEDPDCDVYVLPIPYYDRKPDGSFQNMHYEIEQYPKEVPVVRYETYDFEKRRPDMIFIHNPYDDCNYVTSVPPFFYSRNLKQYTDCLVYIPYFVLGEIEPDNEQAVEGVEHFCTAPGVIHADKVIVQSEKMRQVYVNVLTKAAGKETRKYWEDKILGLGSPKFDKVQRTKKEELEIPKEWLEIICKPGGEWKKVILYNTSVSALLEHQENMLKKIESVLRVFRENRDWITLLWRPHPLIEATICSMRPQLWADYQELVHKYQIEGWGIYDDSPELERAITLCDAYYGDWSSLVQLCQKAGKPIMIQNVEIIERIQGGNYVME